MDEYYAKYKEIFGDSVSNSVMQKIVVAILQRSLTSYSL